MFKNRSHLFSIFTPSKTVVFAAACVFTAFCGCSESKSPPQAPSASPNTAAKSADSLVREDWELCFVQGVRVGYAQTAYYRTLEAGKPALRIEGDMQIAITRNGEELKQRFQRTSIETPEGRVLRFKSEMPMGKEPMIITGRVINNRLHTETISPGKKVSGVIDWSPQCGGFFAIEQSLFRKPMHPGEERTLQAMIEGADKLITIEMLARDWEQTQLLHGTCEALRIDVAATFPDGNKLEQTLWTDHAGEVLKTRFQAMAMETFRATQGRGPATDRSRLS